MRRVDGQTGERAFSGRESQAGGTAIAGSDRLRPHSRKSWNSGAKEPRVALSTEGRKEASQGTESWAHTTPKVGKAAGILTDPWAWGGWEGPGDPSQRRGSRRTTHRSAALWWTPLGFPPRPPPSPLGASNPPPQPQTPGAATMTSDGLAPSVWAGGWSWMPAGVTRPETRVHPDPCPSPPLPAPQRLPPCPLSDTADPVGPLLCSWDHRVSSATLSLTE